MIRGTISEDADLSIKNLLADIQDLLDVGGNFASPFYHTSFIHMPDFATAGVCLTDTIYMLGETKFALYEALAHKEWFKDKEIDRIWTQKFFIDDAALRLYAVGESLASAILYLIGQTKKSINENGKNSKTTSLQNRVGKYMLRTPELANHEITISIKKLVESSSWDECMRYRNKWVHDQPPLIEGGTITFSRKNRIEHISASDDGKIRSQSRLRLGTGDPHLYTIDELTNSVIQAFADIVEVTRSICQYYIDKKKEEDDKHTWVAPKLK